MSEEILYIVSDYVQWQETIDLASTYTPHYNKLKNIYSNCFIATFLLTEKILKEKLSKCC